MQRNSRVRSTLSRRLSANNVSCSLASGGRVKPAPALNTIQRFTSNCSFQAATALQDRYSNQRLRVGEIETIYEAYQERLWAQHAARAAGTYKLAIFKRRAPPTESANYNAATPRS